MNKDKTITVEITLKRGVVGTGASWAPDEEYLEISTSELMRECAVQNRLRWLSEGYVEMFWKEKGKKKENRVDVYRVAFTDKD